MGDKSNPRVSIEAVERALAREFALSDDDHLDAALLTRARSGSENEKADAAALLMRDPRWVEAIGVLASIEAGAESSSELSASEAKQRGALEPQRRPLRRRWGVRVMVALAPVAAAAAAVALALDFRAGQADLAGAAHLPEYVLETAGGDRALRGAKDPRSELETVETYEQESIVDLALRPSSPVLGEVEFEAFLGSAGTLRALNLPVEMLSGGVIRIHGEAGTLFDSRPGDYTLIFVIGRPGTLPPAGAALERARTKEARGSPLWTLIEHHVRIVK